MDKEQNVNACLKTCNRWHSAIIRIQKNYQMRYDDAFRFYADGLFAEYEACMRECMKINGLDKK